MQIKMAWQKVNIGENLLCEQIVVIVDYESIFKRKCNNSVPVMNQQSNSANLEQDPKQWYLHQDQDYYFLLFSIFFSLYFLSVCVCFFFDSNEENMTSIIHCVASHFLLVIASYIFYQIYCHIYGIHCMHFAHFTQ